MTSFAILGTGAIGGYYGARLFQAGFPVHFLCHRDYEVVRTQGLRLDSQGQSFFLPVSAYANAQAMPPCDVVIVALKTTQNHLLAQLLPPLLHPETTVLVFQNGLDVEATAAQLVGAERVVGGLCFICSNKVGPGHIQHLDQGGLTLGHYHTSGLTPHLEWLAQHFTAAQIPVTLAADLTTARWRKLLWNIPFNGLSVVLNCTTDQLLACQATAQLCKQLMLEVLELATATGHPLDPDSIAYLLRLTHQMPPYHTSMKLDYDRGQPPELEAIYATPLRIGNQYGHPAPRIRMLYQQLQFLTKP
jgi:2-dehydropantoate 2-reductase